MHIVYRSHFTSIIVFPVSLKYYLKTKDQTQS